MMRATLHRRWPCVLPRAQDLLSPRAKMNASPYKSYSSTTNVTQPSFWLSLIPKFLRHPRPKNRPKANKKEWNPATFFIIMFLLIGSNSIQMIAIKKDFSAFSRKTNVRINLLQDVIEKIKRGEKVDVESMLGTGNKEIEQKWEDGTVTSYFTSSTNTRAPVVERIERESLAWNESPQESSDCGRDKRHSNNNCSNKSINQSPISPNSTEKIKIPPGFF